MICANQRSAMLSFICFNALQKRYAPQKLRQTFQMNLSAPVLAAAPRLYAFACPQILSSDAPSA